MLEEFIRDRRALILQRTREKVASRSTPRATEYELEEGVPLFLDQLSARLREGVGNSSWTAMEQSASLRGAALWKLGLTIGQVVHDYGNICQAITELAVDLHASIPTEDFQMLNLVLDIAIAEAVTEYSRRNEQQIAGQNVENLGMLAHELRNYLNSATLAYEAVRSGSVGASGSTGAILGRSLTGMRELVTRTLADVRLEAGSSRVERIHVAVILEEIEIAAMTPTANRGVAISLEPVDPEVVVDADYQILTSVLTNLVQNACKFTRPNGHVTVRTRVTEDRVAIEVADECGGLPPGKAEELFRPFQQRGSDRSGLGLGLSICVRGARALGGSLEVRDLPGIGCVFTLDLPRASAESGPDEPAASPVASPTSNEGAE